MCWCFPWTTYRLQSGVISDRLELMSLFNYLCVFPLSRCMSNQQTSDSLVCVWTVSVRAELIQRLMMWRQNHCLLTNVDGRSVVWLGPTLRVGGCGFGKLAAPPYFEKICPVLCNLHSNFTLISLTCHPFCVILCPDDEISIDQSESIIWISSLLVR